MRKIYQVCAGCGEIIWWNKPIIGSLHFCTTDEEQRLYAAQIREKALRNRSIMRQPLVAAAVGKTDPQ